MVSLNNSLADLVKERKITMEDAEKYSTNVEDLRMMLRK